MQFTDMSVKPGKITSLEITDFLGEVYKFSGLRGFF